MGTIINPILPGFHPDPSIIRVGTDYYLAVSTFEWFPGVCIYHSCDLQNWKLAARPLEQISQLDMKGNDASGGVFAPCLSFDGKLFYLVYTNVRTHWYEFMDCHNYLVTAEKIEGPWSEPVYLHSAGFDPSLFHDTDGKKWLVSMIRHYRKERIQKIVLQEYDFENHKLVGEMREIWGGSGLTPPEGPHLYKKDGFYYLLAAEGGTEYGHAETVARAKTIWGPYESSPDNPLLTARNDMTLPLQKAGHGDIVEALDGTWYLVHLCARPLAPFRRCILGRETAIQPIIWENNWPVIPDGSNPKKTVEVSWHVEKYVPTCKRYTFEGNELPKDFHSLRIPLGEAASLTARKGWLRLIGKDSPNSRFEQSIFMRRQEDFSFTFETKLEFSPISERQMAGVLYFYDECDFYYLRVTADEQGNRILDLMQMDHHCASYVPEEGILIPKEGAVWIKLDIEGIQGKFLCSLDGEEWFAVGSVFDASKISDEYPVEGAYTGAMVGIGCHDMLYHSKEADFSYMEYCPRNM